MEHHAQHAMPANAPGEPGCGCGLATAPTPAGPNNQQPEKNTHDEREHQVGWHAQPLHAGGRWADHAAFGANLNEPHASHTRPSAASQAISLSTFVASGRYHC